MSEPIVEWEELDTFLEELRESGLINMLGCAPHIEAEFGVSRREGKRLAKEWLFNMSRRKNEIEKLLTR